MEKIAYIDESGDTGHTKKSTRYFIVTAVITEDEIVLRRIVKNIHKFKLNKNGILHAYKETYIVKNKFINKLTENDIKCVVFVVDKNKMFIDDVYKYALESLIIYFKDNSINNIIVAKKDPRKNYNTNIIDIYKKNDIKLCFSNHQNEISLQVADFYSWVVFVYLEKGDFEYFLQIKHLITFIEKAKPPQGLLAIM
jgi:hypothetical protein